MDIKGLALVGGLAALGGGTLGILGGAIANGNTSDSINASVTPVGSLLLAGFGLGTIGVTGYLGVTDVGRMLPGVSTGAAKTGVLAGVAALAGLGAAGGYWLAMND